MTILLATPFLANHADAGLLWASALGRAGVPVILWDYRRNPTYPYTVTTHPLLALKTPLLLPEKAYGEYLPANALSPWRACYWPDALGRDPESEALLKHYDRVYTCLRPTPKGMIWMPTGWAPEVHYPRAVAKSLDSIFIGTATQRKAAFLSVMEPSAVFGNGWGRTEPVYMDDYCMAMSSAKVVINLHRDGETGVNRRLFESMAVNMTITDVVPGVEEILGSKLASMVGFKTPAEGKTLLTEFLTHEKWRDEAWELERKAIAPYTYDAAVRKVLVDAE